MRYTLFAALLLGSTLAGAQTTTPVPALKSAALKKPIPVDEAVKIGQLPNGLRYYIRRNDLPQHRAELRLVVRAGSLLETDEQRGLAHFMEHMEFNGTQHFPKNELIGSLQKAGVRFGADLNAHTSFDETVYQLPVPTDSARVFRQGFQILEDWAHLATLDSVDIDQERGIVLEERRTGRGPSQRLREQYFPLLLNGARYAQRQPIGTEQVLTTFRHRQLRQFYQDWYRSDLMAVVAVGDFDVAQVEALIREQFGRIPAAVKPRPRPIYRVPTGRNTQVAILTDPEQASTVVQVLYKHPEAPNHTLRDLRESVKRRLFNTLLAGRMRELTQQASSPVLNASSNYGELLGGLDAFTVAGVVRDGRVAPALQALLAENGRVRQAGFTAPELARAKQQLQAGLAQAYAERDKLRSATLAEQYVQHFTEQSAIPSLAFYYDFLTRELPGITLAEVSALAGQYLRTPDRTVIVLAPEKSKATLPTDAQLRALLAAAAPALPAYQDNTLAQPLLAKEPTGAPVVATKEIKELGITEWTLRNGVRVVLKPTTFTNDQVLFSATALGGTSRYELADYPSAQATVPLLLRSGLGTFSQAQLRNALAGKQVRVEPELAELTENLSGVATTHDLSTALQLVYSYFTQPRLDTAAVRSFLASQRSALLTQRATPAPEQALQDTMTLVLGNYNPRRRPLQPTDLARIDPVRALAIYRERFANAADFTFVFVGNLDLAQLQPLVEKYLGALPATGHPESFRDLGIRNPAGPVAKTVHLGLDDKAQVRLAYTGDLGWSADNTAQLDALAELLELQLLEKLREEAGGVYSVGVQAIYAQYPAPRYQLRVSFGCAPANVEKLIAKTQELIAGLQRTGAPLTDIAKYQAETLRENELRLRSNQFWLGYLEGKYLNRNDPTDVLHVSERLLRLTPASTREAANRYFGPNYARFVLLPQPKQP